MEERVGVSDFLEARQALGTAGHLIAKLAYCPTGHIAHVQSELLFGCKLLNCCLQMLVTSVHLDSQLGKIT